MKYLLFIPFGLCGVLLSPQLQAQSKTDKNKEETIVIEDSKGNGNTTIEIRNGEIFIDGKKVADQDGNQDGDVKIVRKKKVIINGKELNDEEAEQFEFPFDGIDNASNRPMLGVTTKPSVNNDGAEVISVVPNSPASKLELKEGDVITKVNDKLVQNPKDLVDAIGQFKPGERVSITFERNNKMLIKEVTLSGRKDVTVMQRSFPMDEEFFRQFNFMTPDMNGNILKEYDFNGPMRSNSPKIGVSVEDRADGEGVQVNDVNAESSAEKAGIKKDDVIVNYDNQEIGNVDDLMDAIAKSQQRSEVQVEVKRNGQKKTLTMKVPKQLKKREL
ncbi:MAG: PDZ domain-containing protein [Chitinophagaceae bacterium]|nr:PDZ domain-containing protein [Chitinophagaceae bacterium]